MYLQHINIRMYIQTTHVQERYYPSTYIYMHEPKSKHEYTNGISVIKTV